MWCGEELVIPGFSRGPVLPLLHSSSNTNRRSVSTQTDLLSGLMESGNAACGEASGDPQARVARLCRAAVFEQGCGEVTSGTLMPEFHMNEDHGHGI
jgi:hypothetical protein